MFCNVCGSRTESKLVENEGIIPFCSSCNVLHFPKSNLACMIVLENSMEEILLLRQNNVSNFMVLIAGYNKPGENLEDTIIRETKEEVGVVIDHVEYLGSYYYEKKNTLMAAFSSKCHFDTLNIDKNEVDEAVWVKKKDVLSLLRKGSIGYQVVTKYLA